MLIILILAAAACAVSVVLAYILYVKIKSFCVLCSSVYGINVLLLIASYWYL